MSVAPLVNRTLEKAWQSKPLLLTHPNKEEGVKAFTMLACQAIQYKHPKEENPLLSRRIKHFTRKYAASLAQFISTHFSFSELSSKKITKLLKASLENYKTSSTFLAVWILVKVPNPSSEEELNQVIGPKLQNIEIDELQKVCLHLFSLYQEKNMAAGFIFLWLIKIASKSEIKIPPLDQFNEETVEKALKFQEFFAEKPTALISLLFTPFPDERPIFLYLFNSKNQQDFFVYTRILLRNGLFKNEMEQSHIIETLFKIFSESKSKQIRFAKSLASSNDSKTKAIGMKFLTLFEISKELKNLDQEKKALLEQRDNLIMKLTEMLPTLNAPLESKKSPPTKPKTHHLS